MCDWKHNESLADYNARKPSKAITIVSAIFYGLCIIAVTVATAVQLAEKFNG